MSINKKTLWILNHYAKDPSLPGGTRHYDLSKELSKLGWNCYIISSSFDHKARRYYPSNNKLYSLNKISESIYFLRIRTLAYSSNSIRRVFGMLEYFIYSLFQIPRGLLPRPDIVIGSNVHILAVLSAYLISLFYRVPFVFEVRDLWPETLVTLGSLQRSSIIYRCLQFLEYSLYRKASLVITLLPLSTNYILNSGISPEKILYIPNGVDLSKCPPLKPLSTSQVPVFSYFGALGVANNMQPFFDAFNQINIKYPNFDWKLNVFGSGPLKYKYIEYVFAHHLTDRIEFHSIIPKDELFHSLANTTFFIMSIQDNPSLYKYGVSMNKLFEYMALSRPVILIADLPCNPVLEANCGFTFNNSSGDCLGDNIVSISGIDHEVLNVCGSNGRNYVSVNHDIKKLAFELSTSLDRILFESLSI